MNTDLSDWDDDLPPEPEEEYQTFVRTLKRTEGFRLLFVRCSPAESKRLISRVQQEVPKKQIKVLQLDKPIENLYNIVVEKTSNKNKIDVLFITGIEKSFVEYIKTGYGGQGNFYKVDSVPRILNHLNQQRERFRDNLKICFIFIVRLFGLKYFIQRAPDFYDWRSGEFEFGQQKVTSTIEIDTQPKLYQQLKHRAEADSEHISATARQAVALYLAHLEVEDE
ncbi:MAG: hypothetical protein KME46_18195 [Brasilonema angustatum HA4187-MV1]|jgi:hypothetical protein|nr:hypothetical protein [Brasilonema angustatum HA4187-MV1]